MTTVKRIEPGHYSTSDDRFIVKESSKWFVLDQDGNVDLGPLPTLASAKEYVQTGSVSLGNHNLGSKHGRRQSKKEFQAYLASEVKKGNSGPAIIYFLIMFIICIILLVLEQK